MARMNISIPDQLKDKMDAIGSVNWSALAAEVFERQVRKSRKVDAMNIEQIYERLEASYEESEVAVGEEGHMAGVSWASETAEAMELEWIAHNIEDAASELYEWRFRLGPFREIDQKDFWGLKRGERKPTHKFVLAFVFGAFEVWDAAKGVELAVLHGHDGPVYSAVFSPDGTRIITASADGTARVWESLSLPDLVVRARTKVTAARALSRAQECEFFLRSEWC